MGELDNIVLNSGHIQNKDGADERRTLKQVWNHLMQKSLCAGQGKKMQHWCYINVSIFLCCILCEIVQSVLFVWTHSLPRARRKGFMQRRAFSLKWQCCADFDYTLCTWLSAPLFSPSSWRLRKSFARRFLSSLFSSFPICCLQVWPPGLSLSRSICSPAMPVVATFQTVTRHSLGTVSLVIPHWFGISTQHRFSFGLAVFVMNGASKHVQDNASCNNSRRFRITDVVNHASEASSYYYNITNHVIN